MTDPAEETYFDTQYQSASLVFGLVMINLLANTGLALFLPTWITEGKMSQRTAPINWWTKWAWGWLIGGNEWWYYFQGAVWLFAFIKHPFFQKAMFWSYIVGNSIAFFFAVAINIMFLVGGVLEYGDWGNLYYPLIFDVLFFGFNAIVYYLLLPNLFAYYRWRDQDWYNSKWTKWIEKGGINLDIDGDDEIFNGM